MYVVHAMPIEAKANPISTAAGTASTAHGDSTMPITHIVTRNAAE